MSFSFGDVGSDCLLLFKSQSNRILNWIIGVVLDGVFNLSIGTVIDVRCTVVPKESRKNGSSNWCQLEHTDEIEKKMQE